MSAIAGIYHFNKEPISLDHSVGIMKALEHFPANDIQTLQKESIFLGCHAQWITPESIGEQLPYYDYERQLAITADAIIDNRDELFDRLQVKQADRKEMPDSKLILLAYVKWGEEAPKYLIGDFAFIIWDEKKHLFFGARDFSGSRTLYFHHSQQRFAFCTIIEPLFSLPYIEKKLNEEWIAEFLAIPWNFESVDTSSSVYKHIEQVPPSHTIRVIEGRITLSRYSTLLTPGEKLQLKSNQEYEEAFQEVFQRAVTERLRTHHNVGSHLSGGLDSGSVVSFAAKALRKENKQLHTFSYVPVNGFVDWTHKSRVADERPHIQSTVQHVGNIKDHYFDFEGKSPLSEVDDWLEFMEMPYKFFENTFWLKGIYEKAHQQGIGVLLNGQRGNWTVSWGPALDYQAMLLKKMNWIRLYHELQLFSKSKGVKKSRVLSLVGKKAFPFINQLSAKDQSQIPMMINPQFANRMNVYDKLQDHGLHLTVSSIPGAYELKKKQFEQLYYWSINGTYGTKLSLRYSLWDRDPTNDLRVIRFCLSLPEEQFVQNGIDRSLIRRSTKSLLPDNVRLNQRTRGVQGADGILRMTPAWSTFMEELQQLCTDPRVSELLNLKAIKEAISKYRGEPRPEIIYELDFRLLMRSLIFYRFIKKIA